MSLRLQELLWYWPFLADHLPAGCAVCGKSSHSEHLRPKSAKQLLKELEIYISIQLEKLHIS